MTDSHRVRFFKCLIGSQPKPGLPEQLAQPLDAGLYWLTISEMALRSTTRSPSSNSSRSKASASTVADPGIGMVIMALDEPYVGQSHTKLYLGLAVIKSTVR